MLAAGLCPMRVQPRNKHPRLQLGELLPEFRVAYTYRWMLVEKPIILYKYLGTPDNSHWPGCAVQNASTKRVENKLLISIPRRMAAVAKQSLSMTRGWPDILVKVLMADSGLVGSAGTCQVNSLKDPLEPLLLWDSEPASGPWVAVALSIHLEAIVTSAKHGTSSSLGANKQDPRPPPPFL